ncbi:unnamed protein product [Rotaria socialis]
MKIATIERIVSVRNHPNADRLDLVSILGYQCITPRDSFLPEQLVVFIQPDSVLPNDQVWAQAYLKYARPRVRAMKLRDEWSEGLIVPLTENEKDFKEGDDVAEQLGIKHFEPVIIQDATSVLGPLPFNIPKTDEERIENFQNNLPWNELVDVTKKIDGTSCSVYYSHEKKQFGVCGRNCEYDLTKSNNFTHIVSKYSLKCCLTNFCEQNHISIDGKQGRYTRRKTDNLFYSIQLAEHLNLPHVPVIESQVPLTQQLIDKYSCEVDLSFGEGVVIQHDHGSFKIINKKYDAKN